LLTSCYYTRKYFKGDPTPDLVKSLYTFQKSKEKRKQILVREREVNHDKWG